MSGTSRREKTSLRTVNGLPTLTHESSNADEELFITINSGRFVTIRRQGKEDSKVIPVRFFQLAEEPLRLEVGPEEKARIYRAPSIWHLLITRPQPCAEYLIPLLHLLRSDWKLSETAAMAERELLRMASGDELPNQEIWERWVEQLADSKFSVREAADRQLRSADQPVLGYLRQLDLKQFDAEQQHRIHRILRALTGDRSDDTPQRIAKTLVSDTDVWLALLTRPELTTRTVAADRLATLVGHAITFDPTADESTRNEQIARLKRLLRPD